jgi:hypothetical protein
VSENLFGESEIILLILMVYIFLMIFFVFKDLFIFMYVSLMIVGVKLIYSFQFRKNT